MMTLVFSNKGNGKTTYAAMLARLEKNYKKYTGGIYSNVPIKGSYKFKVKDLGRMHIENALIIVDEGAIELPNTSPMPEYQKSFMRLSRHYQCDIVFISQSWEDINIVVRRLYDRIYFLKKWFILPPMSSLLRIKKVIGISEDGQIVEQYHYTPNIPFIFTKYIWRPNHYKYFDSYDCPELKRFNPILWDEHTEEYYRDYAPGQEINLRAYDELELSTIYLMRLLLKQYLKSKKIIRKKVKKNEVKRTVEVNI